MQIATPSSTSPVKPLNLNIFRDPSKSPSPTRIKLTDLITTSGDKKSPSKEHEHFAFNPDVTILQLSPRHQLLSDVLSEAYK